MLANRQVNVKYPPIKGKVLATYIWNNTVITDPTTVLNNCRAANINTLYIQWGGPTNAQWQTFIRQAHAENFTVHALDGDATWGLTANQTSGMGTINAVIAYNSDPTTQSDQKFDGIHYDVEAYLNSYWTTNNQDAQFQWYNCHYQYVSAVRNAELIYGAAIPYWLDNGSVSDSDPTLITANTPVSWSKPLWQMFIDLFDQTALMSYNNSPTAQESEVATEIGYAPHSSIVVGFETTNQIPATITYFDQPLIAVQSAVNQVDAYYYGSVGYLGCFIHDYSQLVVLLANNIHAPKAPSRVLAPSRTMSTNR